MKNPVKIISRFFLIALALLLAVGLPAPSFSADTSRPYENSLDELMESPAISRFDRENLPAELVEMMKIQESVPGEYSVDTLYLSPQISSLGELVQKAPLIVSGAPVKIVSEGFFGRLYAFEAAEYLKGAGPRYLLVLADRHEDPFANGGQFILPLEKPDGDGVYGIFMSYLDGFGHTRALSPELAEKAGFIKDASFDSLTAAIREAAGK